MRFFRGFTLVELMVTIAVLAIIAIMAAPSFGKMLVNQKLKQTMVEIKTSLAEARSRALLSRSATVVCPSINDGNTEITKASCGADITNYSSLSSQQKEDSVLLAKVSEKITVKSGSDLSFQFNSQGKTTEKKITICGSDRGYTITIYIPGTVTVEGVTSC